MQLPQHLFTEVSWKAYKDVNTVAICYDILEEISAAVQVDPL